jgi:hypothetical protein
MTSLQACQFCAVLGIEANASTGGEPRYIALQRIFDAEAADESLDDHNERATRVPVRIAKTGKEAKTLTTDKGGAR